MGELYLAKVYKRIFASLLDYVIVFGLAISFFMLLSNGIIDIGFHNESYKQEQYKMQDESHLFDVTKKDGKYVSVNYIQYDTEDKNSYKNYLEAITNYYYNFLNQDEKSNEDLNINFFLFDEKTLQNPVFSINSINDDYTNFIIKDEIINVENNKTYKKGEEGYDEAFRNFFVSEEYGVYSLALTSFTNNIEFQNLDLTIASIERIEIMIVTLFSSILVFGLPFLLNKNGESMFMHLLKIGYTNRNGYKVKFGLKVVRFIMILILNTISVYLYFIPMIVNIIVMFINKEKRSLIDIASGQVCVDLSNSVIYKDYDELENDTK